MIYLQVDSSLTYPIKKGPKNGLFKSQIGLNITVSQELFRDGKIRIKCVGAIEDGILQVSEARCLSIDEFQVSVNDRIYRTQY